MADNKISFSIGAVFSGEGFKKAQSAVKEMSSETKKGISAARDIASAMGGMDSSASKAMGAMSGLMSAMMTMNATTILTQGAMLAFNFVIKEMQDEMEKLTKKSDALKASVQKSFDRSMQKQMTELSDELKAIDGNFDQITKRANAFTAALNGVVSATSAGGIADLEIEKLNALLEAHSEAERQTIEATYAHKIAVEKSANSAVEWSSKVESAGKAVSDAQQKLAKTAQQEDAVARKRVELEEMAAAYREHEDKRWRDVQKRVDELKRQEADLSEKRIAQEQEIETLLLLEEKTKIEADNAAKASTAEILKTTIASEKLNESIKVREEKDRAAAKAAEEKAAADAEAAERSRERDAALKEAEDYQKQVNDSAASLKKAQDDYAEALRKYNENFAENTVNEALGGLSGKGSASRSGAIPVNVMKAIEMKVSAQAVEDAIKNGLVTSVKDADKLARQAAREARDLANKNSGTRAQESKRYERLLQTPVKDWSKADQDFATKFKAIQEAASAQKRDLDEKRAKLAEERARAEKLVKSLDALSKSLSKSVSRDDMTKYFGPQSDIIKTIGKLGIK